MADERVAQCTIQDMVTWTRERIAWVEGVLADRERRFHLLAEQDGFEGKEWLREAWLRETAQFEGQRTAYRTAYQHMTHGLW